VTSIFGAGLGSAAPPLPAALRRTLRMARHVHPAGLPADVLPLWSHLARARSASGFCSLHGTDPPCV